MKKTAVFDTEIYVDYFLLSLLNADTGNIVEFEMFEGQPFDIAKVKKIMATYRLVSFNGNNFDMPIIAAALQGANCKQLKAICDKIIQGNTKPWMLGIDIPACDHVDLIEVAPGIASLKIYGGRMHFDRMQDLPIPPEANIAPEQRPLIRSYCRNDLRTTLALFNKLAPQITLREQMGEQYGIDLRSKSDAQIAEAVIRHEVERRIGNRLPKRDPFEHAGRSFKYKPPEFIEYDTATLRDMLALVRDAEFVIQANGVVKMPKEIADLRIQVGQSRYQMGIGGLHSTEKSVAHLADDDNILVDRDVASYYPSIILNCGLRPVHMGDHFTAIYKTIVRERLAAKNRQAIIKQRIAELEKELFDANAEASASQKG